ncbi:MAG TPA: hypothetical protein VHB68_09450 [Steroidobacteraceae bacterium]|nr:hypothetical protein [Steroidobacteraceae bacterium]
MTERQTVPGVLGFIEHFLLLDREQQAQAIRRLAASGGMAVSNNLGNLGAQPCGAATHKEQRFGYEKF